MTRNLHLVISAITLTLVSFTYGLSPGNTLPKLFDFQVASIDLKQVFRATMGLYLGMVSLWIIGIVKPSHWRTATLSNIFLMAGLALGRIISLIVDGVPSIYFLVGLALELTFALWGIKNLSKYISTCNNQKPSDQL